MVIFFCIGEGSILCEAISGEGMRRMYRRRHSTQSKRERECAWGGVSKGRGEKREEREESCVTWRFLMGVQNVMCAYMYVSVCVSV